MKKVEFTEQERSWLLPLMESRVEVWDNEKHRVPARYSDSLRSAMLKLSENRFTCLKEWERIMCSSCASDELSDLYQTATFPHAFNILDLSSYKRRQLKEIDMGERIKLKVGRSENGVNRRYVERISYQEYFKRIDKLKQAAIIFLSGTHGISPYKIGFFRALTKRAQKNLSRCI